MLLVMLKARVVARGQTPLLPLSHSHTTAEKINVCIMQLLLQKFI